MDIWSDFDKKHINFPEPAEERYVPIRFKKEFEVFRVGHLNASRITELTDKTELPTNSILHILDDVSFEEHSDTPRLENNRFVQQESYLKCILHIREFQKGIVEIDKKLIFRPSGLPTRLMKFRAEQGSKFRYLNAFTDIPQRKEVLTIINHNPLFRGFVYGKLPYLRKIQSILASVLNTIVNLIPTGKQQFVLIPWSNEIFNKALFIRSRKEISQTSVKFPNSFHYIFMMHLLNYIFDGKTTSMFEELPEGSLDNVVFILQNDDKYLFYNLSSLKALNKKNRVYLRIVNQLNALSVAPIVDELPETHPIKQEFKSAFEETDDSFEMEPEEDETHIVDSDETSEVIEDDEFVPEPGETKEYNIGKTILDKIADTVPRIKKSNISPISSTVPNTAIKTTDVDISSEEEDNHIKTYIEERDAATDKFIDEQEHLTPKQKERCKRISRIYKTLKLDGETLEDILTKDTDLTITDGDVDPDLVGDIPDKSALRSSLTDFDHIYMKKTFKRHLAATITDFQKNGVYLVNLTTEKVNTQMDKFTQYSLKFVDIDGKTSTVKFKIPNINHEGRVVIDGVEQVLKKQRISLPIVKISDVEVSLASNYNKTRIERNNTKAHSFRSYIGTLLSKSTAKIEYGGTEVKLAASYEYCTLTGKYKSIDFTADGGIVWRCYFDYPTRLTHFGDTEDKLKELEKMYGIYFAKTGSTWYFVDSTNMVHGVLKSGGEDVSNDYQSITDVLKLSLRPGEKIKPLTEWTSIKILDKQLPIIFMLAYRYGLRNTLEYLGSKYAITDKRTKIIVGESATESFVHTDRIVGDINPFGDDWIKIRSDETDDAAIESLNTDSAQESKYAVKQGDIPIKFADRTLWINRYPLTQSLIICGLEYFDCSQYSMADFESKDIYHQLLSDKGMSTNYLKGIDSFFDLFIDNMTYSVLKMMKEPTNVRDLLIRATELLTTLDHRDVSSRRNHRIRGYEQFVGIVYNEMSRQLAAYKTRRGKANIFSVNPEAIYLRIAQNASMVVTESPNPLQNIKEQAAMTYAGVSGRTAESFVLRDRKLASDDIGIISEGSVDNQKVGINAQLAYDPGITNTMGILEPADELKPANILSITALTFPFSTHDDSKRMNFISTQTSHVIPTKCVDKSRIRTGYERLIAHRCGRKFAGIAEKNGQVIEVNNDAKIARVKYEDGTIDAFEFGEIYTEYEGFHVTQEVICPVTKGQKFKKGEVITYNKGYFNQDPTTGQLDYSIGVLANVAFLEYDTTLEDSIEISPRLSDKLSIRPVNTRVVTLPSKSLIHSCVSVGDHVSNTDPLLVFEEEPVDGSVLNTDDQETMSILGDLNRKTPKAKFSGKVVKIEAYFGCPTSKMHRTLASIVKSSIATNDLKTELAAGSIVEDEFPPCTVLPKGTKYKGVYFDEDTVCLIFYIQEEIKHSTGDKLVLMNQLKCTCAGVFPNEVYSESGVYIDAFFSQIAVGNRVVMSPMLYGVASRCLEKAEEDVLKIYFGE